MNTSPGKIFRRSLLGIANEEEECRVEEAILNGEVNATFLQNVEDELIDDYLLGSFTNEEKQGFVTHFLTVDEREERVTFAAALVEYAQKQSAEKPLAELTLVPRSNIFAVVFWKPAALLATAAAFLLAVVVGFKQVQLRHEVQIANAAQNELARLDALSTGNGGISESKTQPPEISINPLAGTELMPAIEIGPSTTRGIKAKELRIPTHVQFVRINLELSSPLADQYRVVLLPVGGKPILVQDFPASALPATQRSTIVLPTWILQTGSYHLQIEGAPADGPFKMLEDHTIHVTKE